MELERIYLLIFAVLVVAFCALMGLYVLYTLQQKVTSVALTSADVAFFPVRITAVTIRAFFRLMSFCFDSTLFALRMFLVSIRMVLSTVETMLLMWRVPIVIMLSIVQRITKMRKARKEKGKPKTEVMTAANHTTKTTQTQTSEDPIEDEDTKAATGVFRTALDQVRRVKHLLRPDLLILKKSSRLFGFHKYLRQMAGLEKSDVTAPH